MLIGHYALLLEHLASDLLHALSYRHDNTWHGLWWTSLLYWLKQVSDIINNELSTWSKRTEQSWYLIYFKRKVLQWVCIYIIYMSSTKRAMYFISFTHYVPKLLSIFTQFNIFSLRFVIQMPVLIYLDILLLAFDI